MPFLSETQVRELPEAEKKIYAELMQRVAQYANEPYSAGYNPVYPGQRIAEIHPSMRESHGRIGQGVGAELPLFEGAQQNIQQGMKPFHENYQQYMNPYQQDVLRQLSEEGNRNFKENVMPALDARFFKLGQFGSTRHADLAGRAARDFQKELLNNQQKALMSGFEQAGNMYNAAQNRRLEGASQLSNMAPLKQGVRMSDTAALEGIGRYEQQQKQSILDAQYQEYLRQLEEPIRRLGLQSSILHGLPSTGLSVSAFRETPPTAPTATQSNLSNIAGTLLSSGLLGGRR
jgi:hypothetical protein